MAEGLKCPLCETPVDWHEDAMPLLRTHLFGFSLMAIENGFCATYCQVYLHTRLRENRERATAPQMLPGGCCMWLKPEMS